MEIFKIDCPISKDAYLKLEKEEFEKEVIVKTNVEMEYNNKIINLDFYLKNAVLESSCITIKYNYQTQRYLNKYCCFCGLNRKSINECIHISYLLDKYNNNEISGALTKEEIDLAFFSLEEQKREQEEKNKKEKMISLLNSLENELNQAVSSVSNNIHLLPNIKYDDESISISLKIGIDKYYVIKDIRDLLYYVSISGVYEYGKGLKINHNINNFDESAKKCINILKNYSVDTTWYDVRNKELSYKACQEIIEAYKGKIILINDNNCFISLDDYIPNISIQNDKINFDDIDNIQFLQGNDYDFIIKNNNVLKLACDNEMRVLVKFLICNRDFNYSIVKDEFAQRIVSRFVDTIDIDEEFKNEFMIKELAIKAYFDYNKDELLLDVKYFIDDTEINEEDIKKNNFISKKYTKFWSVINKLGFENNVIKDINLIGNFLTSNLEELKEYCEIYLSNNIKDMQVKKLGSFRSNLSYNSGMLKICFEGLKFSNEELNKIINGIKKNLKYIKLSKNVILEADEINSSQLLTIVEEFNLKENKLSEEQEIPLYQGLKLADDNIKFGDLNVDLKIKDMISDIANYKDADYKVPSNLSSVLRSYQVNAFKWMKTLVKYNFCGILADDMGLGKTLEIISLIVSDETEKPSLIVCPKSLVYNWQNEFKKWASDIDVQVISGNSNERKKVIDIINNDQKIIFITSYDSLRNDLDIYKDYRFRFCILDEAQFIKNHTTLKAQSVKQIVSEIRFALTGTPIENTVVDLWSLFDFLMPNYLFNYKTFKNNYEKEIIVKNNRESIKKLVKKITPFILRRTKKEVLKDLPEKIELVRYTTMEDEQLKMYEAELLKTRQLLTKNNTNKIEVLSALTRLRQICVHPKMYYNEYQGTSAKINLLMELLDELLSTNHKVLIFSQFTTVFDYISKELEQRNIKYFTLTGKTSAIMRMEMANIFNKKTSEQKVFLISLKAGGTGLNLIGADTVIQLDPWWNVAAENQASDRAHRIGQDRVVQVIKIICENSIEQKVLELQEMKSDVVNKVIADNDENIIKLNEKDLQYLLEN